MRHRKIVDERGDTDPARGAAGGRPPVWRVDAAPAVEVLSRDFTALRVVGIAHRGAPSFADLQTLSRKVDERVRAAGLKVAGPVFSVLRSNPFEEGPSFRKWLTCLPIVGPASPPEGMVLDRVSGGLHLLAASPGSLRELEKVYGYLFGRFLSEHGYELARPQAPEIRHLYPTPPHEVAKESTLVVEVAVPAVITMRADTMRNQH